MRASRLTRAALGLALVLLVQPASLRSGVALTPEELVRHLTLQEGASVRVEAEGKTGTARPRR
jgi:hypothetical protein